MDQGLVAWGYAVKQRRRTREPVLWLFTDAARLADPLAAARRLPKGLCGVVLRHEDAQLRAELAVGLAKICKARRLALVVAGDVRLAARVGAGVHLRRGQWPGVLRRRRGIITASVHNAVEMQRARRTGARFVFLSPAFATASHAGASYLGAVRWARLAGQGCYALGGVDGGNVRRLGGRAAGIGAITALLGDR